MRHRVDGRKLGRTSEHRLALLRNLSTALFEREKIRTTLAKAKELRPFAERLVTLSKRETLHARRLVLRHIKDPKVVSKLFDALSARYAQRPGGYTRIIKLGPRRGDNAEMAIVELVGAEDQARDEAKTDGGGAEAAKGGSRKKGSKAAAKKQAAAEGEAKPARPARKKTAKKAATARPVKKAPAKKATRTGAKKGGGKSGAGD